MPSEPPGFLKSLFDLSFEHLVTPKVIKFIYVVSIVLAGLAALFYTAVAFQINAGLGVLVLIVLAPLAFLFMVIYTRIFLEVVMALFKVAENTTVLAAASAGAPVVVPPAVG
ncbi:MAG: hypothetical protein QOE11_1328 [Solirubrobacteraceae bacterium]|jgi:hypothetical protein|nr:hypothetical protein [Solirubrobacteraceae bacterium]